jgi:hypothetical protein
MLMVRACSHGMLWKLNQCSYGVSTPINDFVPTINSQKSSVEDARKHALRTEGFGDAN